ncbi:MAG: hypothetical protein GY792_27815 [Gammaproteobacteria bacterium]|nr:hypothetical protein [Gammaproteobacteria bacterium]
MKIVSGVLIVLIISLYTAQGVGDTMLATELEDRMWVCPKGFVAYGLGCDGACSSRILYCKEKNTKPESRNRTSRRFSKGRNKGDVDKSGHFVFAIQETEETFTLVFDQSVKSSSSNKCDSTRKEKCPNNTLISGLFCNDEECLNPKLICCPPNESDTEDQQQETDSE